MKEIEELLQIFGAAGHPDLAAALENISKITFYQKGEKLYEIGEVQSKVYLLLDGILRCYLIDDTRSDITDCFMSDRFMAANSADFFIESNRVPSFVGMEALTDASVLEIDADPLFVVLQRYPQLARIYAHCLQNALNFQNEINYKRLYLSGKERYAWFRKKWPEVDRIASNRQIATFLGIRS